MYKLPDKVVYTQATVSECSMPYTGHISTISKRTCWRESVSESCVIGKTKLRFCAPEIASLTSNWICYHSVEIPITRQAHFPL